MADLSKELTLQELQAAQAQLSQRLADNRLRMKPVNAAIDAVLLALRNQEGQQGQQDALEKELDQLNGQHGLLSAELEALVVESNRLSDATTQWFEAQQLPGALTSAHDLWLHMPVTLLHAHDLCACP